MMMVFLLFLFLGANFLWVLRIRCAISTLKQVPILQIPPETASSGAKLMIVIPARNEEENLPCCLRSIIPQLTPNIACLAVNDRSTDKTEAQLIEQGFTLAHDRPLPQKSYLNLTQKPPLGWTGKNNALHAASSFLDQAEWLLFTDADTHHQSGGIQAALNYAIQHKLDLLTLTPKCLTASPIERLIQPTAMGLMGLWYPLNRTNEPEHSDHFANGQFLLIRTDLYRHLGGHASVHDCFLEDFALMKKSKQLKAKVLCARGQELYGTRMYRSLTQLWRGWRRIYLHGSQQRPITLLKQAVELLITSVLPAAGILVLAFWGTTEKPALYAVDWGLAILWLGLTFATAISIYQTLQGPRRYALLHPLAALIIVGILCDAVRCTLFKQKTQWRG